MLATLSLAVLALVDEYDHEFVKSNAHAEYLALSTLDRLRLLADAADIAQTDSVRPIDAVWTLIWRVGAGNLASYARTLAAGERARLARGIIVQSDETQAHHYADEPGNPTIRTLIDPAERGHTY